MCRIAPCFTFLLAIGVAVTSAAQEPSRIPRSRAKSPANSQDDKLPDTQLELELITGDGGVDINARRWSEMLEKLDVAVRIRRGTSKDEPGVTEKNLGGTLRFVSIIATLDRRGRISLPGKAFSLSDKAPLMEWLRDLRTYGAQGSPEGQPAWGLSESQMEQVLKPLRKPMTLDPLNKNLLDALVLFTPDLEQGDLPIHVTPEAKLTMAEPRGEKRFPQSLLGLSRGTALSIVLQHYGLCFTPNRTPAGDLELSLRKLDSTPNPWKVGWPFPEKTPRIEIAPNLFKMVNVELEDLPLADVTSAASNFIEIPILLDYAEMEKRDIDIDKIRVNYPRKRTTWASAIKRIAFQSRLTRELYVDEAGKPFVWLTPIKFKGRVPPPKN